MEPIYLDYAASTPTKPQVANIFIKSLNLYGNPSSTHEEGRKAKQLIDNASQIIANKLNCLPEEIHYTTGATMSNNLLIQGFKKKYYHYVFVSMVEHNDIEELFNHRFINGDIRVKSNGILDLYHLNYWLSDWNKENTKCLVSIQMANSEPE